MFLLPRIAHLIGPVRWWRPSWPDSRHRCERPAQTYERWAPSLLLSLSDHWKEATQITIPKLRKQKLHKASATRSLTCTAPAGKGLPQCPKGDWWRCWQRLSWANSGWGPGQQAWRSASPCQPASAASSRTPAWAEPGASAAWPPPLSHTEVKDINAG